MTNYTRGDGGFTLSEADRQNLQQQYDQLVADLADGERSIDELGLITPLYQALLSAITDPITGLPKTGVDASVWTWINGAAGVNARSNFNGAFIHEITKKQYELRFGDDGTDLDALAQIASNELGLAVISDVLTGGGGEPGNLPDLEGLALLDAGLVAAGVFGGSDGQGEDFAPWAGTILFPYLGRQDFYRDWVLSAEPVVGSITSNGSTDTVNLKTTSGSYDLIATIEAARAATVSAAWSGAGNFWEAVQTAWSRPSGVPFPDQSDLATETSQWFQAYYGLSDIDRFKVGNDTIFFGGNIFERISQQIGNKYQSGTLGDDTDLTTPGGGPFAVTNSGSGDDTIFVASDPASDPSFRPANLIDGSDGFGTVDYGFFLTGIDIELQPGIFGEHEYRVVVDGGATGNQGDYLYTVEHIVGTGYRDTWTVNGDEFDSGLPVSIDLAGGFDVADFSGMSEGVAINRVSAVTETGGIIKFDSIEEFVGTDHNDVFENLAVGSLLTTGGGEDAIHFSKGLGVTDADGSDRVIVNGKAVGLALRFAESESPFAFAAGGVKVGFNKAGEMVIGTAQSRDEVGEDFMYLMEANQNPMVAASELTAGIRVAEVEIESFKLLELPEGRNIGAKHDCGYYLSNRLQKTSLQRNRQAFTASFRLKVISPCYQGVTSQ